VLTLCATMSCSSRAIRARSSLTAARAFCSPSRSSTTVRSASLSAREPWLRTARPAIQTLAFMTAMKKKLPNSPSTTASSTKAGTSTTAAPMSAALSSQCAATEYIASTIAAIPKTVTSGVFDASAKTVRAAITALATAIGARTPERQRHHERGEGDERPRAVRVAAGPDLCLGQAGEQRGKRGVGTGAA
jgi:hypothetical protein